MSAERGQLPTTCRKGSKMDAENGRAAGQVSMATERDLKGIVGIHRRAFPGFFLTRLGKQFLYEYYRLVLDYSGGVLMTIAADSGDLAGFAAGLIEPQKFYAEMKKSKWRFVRGTVPALLRRPVMLFRLIFNFVQVKKQSQAGPVSSQTVCELSSIAVDPLYAGKRWGQRLLGYFFDHLRERGIGTVVLTTDASDNDAVNRFYRDCGFKLDETIPAYGGRIMNRYVIGLDR